MVRKLNEGDIVTVQYVDGQVLRGVAVVHIPWDTGDSWHFEDADGTLFIQNPISANLDTIIRLPDDDK